MLISVLDSDAFIKALPMFEEAHEKVIARWHDGVEDTFTGMRSDVPVEFIDRYEGFAKISECVVKWDFPAEFAFLREKKLDPARKKGK